MATKAANFYTYELDVDGVCRYVGKGCDDRKDDHVKIVRSIARRRAAGEIIRTTRFYKKLTEAWLAGAEISISVITEGLTEREAFAEEVRLIAAAPPGQLWNSTAGGDGFDSDFCRAREADPEHKIQRKAAATAQWANPTTRALMEAALKAAGSKISAAHKATWAKPEHQAKMKVLRANAGARPEFRAKRKAVMDTKWADPEARRVNGEMMKALWADPEYRAKMKIARKKQAIQASAQMKKLWTDTAYRTERKQQHISASERAARSDRLKALWNDQQFKAKAKKPRPSTAEKMKALWADPERKAKMKAAQQKAMEERRQLLLH